MSTRYASRKPLRFIGQLAGLALIATSAAAPIAAQAADATVNTNAVNFEPLVAYIDPGDSVNWQGMTGHNVETLGAMIPEGGTTINSELGADLSQQFDVPGIYVYKCTPHWGARMGGVVVVGKPENAAAIIEAYLAAIETDRPGLLPAKGLLKKLSKDLESKSML